MAPQVPSQRWRAELRLFEFTTSVTELGWGAVCDLDGHTVRIEPGRTGWRVTNALRGESFHTTVDAAVEAAVEMVLDLELVLALKPHLAAEPDVDLVPELAELIAAELGRAA